VNESRFKISRIGATGPGLRGNGTIADCLGVLGLMQVRDPSGANGTTAADLVSYGLFTDGSEAKVTQDSQDAAVVGAGRRQAEFGEDR
jgi:hypothetical protein